jgi:preprotein translocase subunit SecD
LQGGVLVLVPAAPPPGITITRDRMEAARGIIEQRVNGLGVAEPRIQLVGDNRVLVELPGISDPEQAIRTFHETGLLEFVNLGDDALPEGTDLSAEQYQGKYTTVLTGQHLRNAEVGFDEQGFPEIQFEFDAEGARTFEQYTSQNIGKWLAITMDKKVIQAATIRSAISDRGRITGRFGLQEARSIVLYLKYGALPVPMEVVSSQTIGPTLGQEAVDKSMVAGAVGLSIVMLFMLLYYRLPGLLANLALILYTLFVYAVFRAWPVTLTLAGIAGFVLSIGMAVDANILIFERMKEELRAGRSLAAAIDVGFNRAWTSIRDSNLATIITSVILFWFGTGSIRGFAITLIIGVVISMFTAIVVTRTFLRLLVGTPLAQRRWLFGVEATPAPAAAARYAEAS